MLVILVLVLSIKACDDVSSSSACDDVIVVISLENLNLLRRVMLRRVMMLVL